MINSKADYRFYISEDYKHNLGAPSFIKLLIKKLYRSDDYMAYNYLKALRKYEYAINVLNNNIIGRMICKYRQFIWRSLSIKYNIVIPPNVIGYGFRMAHVVGGA